MRNPKITYEQCIAEQLIFSIEEAEASLVKLRSYRLTFQPYDNRQGLAILDLQDLIPGHHVARVTDEIFEAVPDSLLLAR